MSPRAWNVLVWAGLLALLVLTVGLSYLPLGRWGLAVAALIAGGKATLIGLIYMEVLERGHLPRLAGVALASLLVVLFGMTLWLT